MTRRKSPNQKRGTYQDQNTALAELNLGRVGEEKKRKRKKELGRLSHPFSGGDDQEKSPREFGAVPKKKGTSTGGGEVGRTSDIFRAKAPGHLIGKRDRNSPRRKKG